MSEGSKGGSKVVVNLYRLTCREKVEGSQRVPLLTKIIGEERIYSLTIPRLSSPLQKYNKKCDIISQLIPLTHPNFFYILGFEYISYIPSEMGGDLLLSLEDASFHRLDQKKQKGTLCILFMIPKPKLIEVLPILKKKQSYY